MDSAIILKKLKDAKPRLERQYFVKTLALFGSYRKNTFIKGKSDIDIVVEFTKPIGIEFIDLANDLEEILNNKVDLVSRKGIKPEYFSLIKPDLIYV